MTVQELIENMDSSVKSRAQFLYAQHRKRIFKRTDRLFVGLMLFQWMAGIIIALVVSPQTWIGAISHTHVHVWAAIFLGGGIAVVPILLGLLMPGEAVTRYVIAVAQMLFSALLIHLTGGRIETHFHVFGSLAFLAFYRDWKVLIPATIVVGLDHMLRGIFWPQSVFGVLTVSSWRWVEHTAWVIFEDIFLIVSCRRSVKEMWDIAEKRAQLEANNQLVKARMEERTQELKKSQETLAQVKNLSAQLEQSNRDLEQFAYTAAHDLRSPLQILKMYSQILQKKYNNPEAGDLIKAIIDNANNLDNLTTSLLGYAKVQKDRNGFQQVDCDVVLQRALNSLALDIQKSGAKVTNDALGSIYGDQTLLAQLFQNLISNAIKFRSEASPSIEITRSYDEKISVFAVKDNGLGIKEPKEEGIFEIFRRGNTNLDGTGIGLATCKKIVELHGGKIWVESQAGQGSTFYFTLAEPVAIQ